MKNKSKVEDVSQDENAKISKDSQKKTDNKSKMVQIQENENYLMNILDSYPDAIVYFNNDRKIELVNDAFCYLFGYDKSDIEGQDTRVLYFSEQEYIENGKNFYDHDNPFRFEPYTINFVTKKGKNFVSRVAIKPLIKNKLKISGYIAVFSDVHKMGVENSVQSQVNGKATAFCTLDIDTLNLTYADSEFKKLFGHKADSDVSVNYTDLIVMDDKKDSLDFVKKSFENNLEAFSLENLCISKEKKMINVLWSFVVFYNEKKAIVHVTDISIEKRIYTETCFKASLLDQIEDRITACDLNGVITYVNEAEAKTFGKQQQELIGLSVHDYGEDLTRGAGQQEIIDKTIENGYWKGKVINFTHDGSAVCFNSRTSIIYDKNKNPVGLVGISTDITEQEEKAQKLKESEIRFKSVFEQSAVGELLIDEDFYIKEVNHTFLELLGYSKDEVEDKSLLSFVSQADQINTQKQISEAFTKSIESKGQILRFRHKEGHLVWFRQYFRIFNHPTLSKKRAVIAVVDFSEIHESHLALQESEELFKSIFAQSAIGISRNSVDGEFIVGNKKFEEITGYSSAELKKLHFKEITYKKDLEIELELLDKMLCGEINEYNMEKRIWHKSGRLLWTNIFVNIVRDRFGKAKYWIASLIDISQQKRNQREFNTINERLHLALKSADIGIWDLDLNSDFLFWDNRMHELYETSENEFENNYDAWQKYVDPLDLEETELEIQESIFHMEDLDIEFGIITGKGNKKIIKAYAKVYADENGRPIRMIGINIDVTENRMINQNLKSALKDKEILLRELYHRTKNNMQVISSMLAMESYNQKDQTIEKVFNEMVQRIQTMSLVHNKLYQSKNLTRIDLQEYLSDLALLLVKSNSNLAQKIEVETDMIDLNIVIEIAVPVGLILNELITNSIKYAFNGKDSGKIYIKTHKEEGFIVITYQDNGVGLKKGFDIERDSNLGLTLIKNLIKRQLDGHLRFGSDAGFNFQFRFKDDIYQESINNG